MTSQTIDKSIGGQRSVDGNQQVRSRRVPVWITTVTEAPRPSESPPQGLSNFERSFVLNPANGFVRFRNPSSNSQSERRTPTGEASPGRATDPSGQSNFRFRTGFPESGNENSISEKQTGVERFSTSFRTPRFSRRNTWRDTRNSLGNQNPVSMIESNNERIRRLEAERRRLIQENIRKKYQNNAFLNTRGLVSGVRIPTRSQVLSRDSTSSNQIQRLMSPGTDASNQNRAVAFARRTAQRPVVSTDLNDQQSTVNADRQSARELLKEVSVPRSRGANSYLKSLLYNALRRVNKN